ncbi:retrovirus-related pol polyprotein from transposon TNT 1-94 [Tanacetum coccineum]
MSTSNTHQQSLADAGSETLPPMLERGSYIPWASHFRRYLNQKRENRKCLNKAIGEGPYEFRTFTPSDIEAPRMQKEEDLRGDDLKHYEAEIEAMNLILISILNDIYNSVDACKTAKAMWKRVERLMRRTVQNKVDKETRFNNEFDQFVAELGEALVSVYNRFAQLMNDFERNDIIFLNVTKLENASRAKKVEKSQIPLALMAHTGSYSRTTTPYYVTYPFIMVDYDEDYQVDVVQNNSEDPLTYAMILLACAITQRFSNPTNNHLRTSSNTRNQAIVQGDRVNIQRKNSWNDGRNIRRLYVQEEIIEGNNVHNDAGNIQRTLQTTSSRTATNVQCYNCSEKGCYARNCPNLRVQDSKYFIEQLLLAK